MKTYTVRYYEPKVGADGKGGSVAQLLDKIHAMPNHAGTVREAGKNKMQLRVHQVSNDRKEYRCFFVRYRDELPIVMNVKSHEEKPPHLDNDEELIEKNHFSLYVSDTGFELLAYQVSMEGSLPSALSTYLNFINEYQFAVSLNEIVKADAYARIMAGESVIKSIEFEVAKPRSRSYAPDPNDTWTKESIDFMSKTGGTRFRGKVQTRSQGKGLLVVVKDAVKYLFDSTLTKKLKVKLSDVDQPIDLFTDRIIDKISVEVVNGWPDSNIVFGEMFSMYRQNKDLLPYLVAKDEALDLD